MSLNKLGCSETLPGLSTIGTEDTAGLQNSGSCFVLSDHAWASSMDDAYPSPCMQPVDICASVSWESYPSSIRTNSLANRLSQPRLGTVTSLFLCLCFSRRFLCVVSEHCTLSRVCEFNLGWAFQFRWTFLFFYGDSNIRRCSILFCFKQPVMNIWRNTI